MKKVPHLGAFVLFLLYVHCSQAKNSTLRCDGPPPQDQSQSPTFLCDVDITVVRNEDCSANITERYLFPYTTGRDAFRRIPLIDGQQSARNVLAMRDNLTVFEAGLLQSEKGRNEARVVLPTKKNRQSVLFTLQYILDAGVTQFTTSCPETSAEPLENETVNVIRWRTGSWQQTFDRMRVSFIIADCNALLSVAAAPEGKVLSSSTTNYTIITWRDVSTSIDVLVTEKGTNICAQQLQCFSSAGGFGRITAIILGYIACWFSEC